MSYNSLAELFTAIAGAIRSKTGGTTPIVANDFPASIAAISGGGAPDTGAMCLAYHVGGDYESTEMEGAKMYRLTDLTPTHTEIDEAVFILPDTANEVAFFDYVGVKLKATSEEDVFIPLEPVNENISLAVAFMVVREEALAMFGFPSAGIWVAVLGEDKDFYLIWEP